MTANRLIELLTKKESGELSLPELKELKELLGQRPEDAFLMSLVDELFRQRLDYENGYSVREMDVLLQRLHRKLKAQEAPPERPLKIFRLSRMVVAAACLLLLAGAGVLLFYASGNRSLKQNVVATNKRSKSYILLPDGTQVWLNADSRVAYKDDFGKKNREISLAGEAYFDVVKDKERPFIIHTEAIDVKVLGTAFNVRAYKNDGHTETTLIRGSVEISMRKDPARRFLLKPFEKISIDNSEALQNKHATGGEESLLYALKKIKPVEDSSGAAETQWLKNRLVFDKQPLDDIARELSRWFDVEIFITDAKLRNTEYSGAVEEAASLEQVLESLKLTGAFHYTIHNKTVTISP